jgi:hypothetical protein
MYADRYNNGVATRLVHYLGKEWHDTKIVGQPERRHFTSVKADSRQRYPRTFGVGTRGN